MSEEQKKFIPPNSIENKDYIYTYKDELKNNFYTYRCKFRKSCGIVIKIHKDELIKYMENNNIELKYEITSKLKEHKCKDNNNKVEETEKISNKLEDKRILIKSLIIQNLDRDLNFHAQNLSNNNIHIKRNSLKWMLQKIREEKYPTAETFLQDISKILITYENIPNMENLPICYKYSNVINLDKNYRLEKYIIFTSSFQIKLLKKCTQIYLDGTFKSCPKGYYQILNFSGFLPDINALVPIFMIPLTGKSLFMYNEILNEVKKIIEDTGINIENIPKRFMLDFEVSLQKAVKNNFPESIVDGCYFHYTKLLWEKAKKLGLCTKKEIKYTKIIIFMLKIMPYLSNDKKEELFNNLEGFFGDNDEKYVKLLKYYKKNWLNNEYLNYSELTVLEYSSRTNNYLESFHHVLNQSLKVYHPKISYLIDKYKEYLINIYNKIKVSIVNINEEKAEKFSIINDIYKFLKKYNEKYKSNINIHNIIQNEGEEETEIIMKVSNYLLSLFLDYEEDNEENELENVQENEIEINNLNNVNENNEGSDEEKIEEEGLLNFEDFYPEEIVKGKRTYKQAFGEPNELKKFQEGLKLKNQNIKKKK